MNKITAYYRSERVTLYRGNALEILPIGASGGVMVTDPPYGMGFKSGRGGAFGKSSIAGDETTCIRDAILAMWQTAAIVFGRWSVPRPEGVRMVLTWDKGEHVGMGDLALPWKPNTEEIYIIGYGFDGHRGSSVIRELAIAGTVGNAANGTRHHPTEKPVSLMYELVKKCKADVVVDPFMGSGTTGVAAMKAGKKFIGIEIVERYCDIAKRRIQEAEQAFALFEPVNPESQTQMFGDGK